MPPHLFIFIGTTLSSGPPTPHRLRGGSGNRPSLPSTLGAGMGVGIGIEIGGNAGIGGDSARRTPLSPVLASGMGPLSHRTTNSRTNPIFAIGHFYIGGSYDNEIEEV